MIQLIPCVIDDKNLLAMVYTVLFAKSVQSSDT